MASNGYTRRNNGTRPGYRMRRGGYRPSAEHDIRTAKHNFHSWDYINSILTSLNKLRENRKFSDVIISVADEEFFAHRVVLAASSPYFEAMFSSGLAEQQDKRVEIQGISSSIFSELLKFIYSGEIKIIQENVQDLLAAANMLEIPQVVSACCSFLQKELHPSNCVGICQFAELHACTNLKLEAKRYIERNFIEVIQEDEFCELPKDALKSFLRSEGLNIDSEFQVFQATMKWILHDVTHRQKYVSELLEAVRLPVISIKQLDSYAQECPDLNLKVSLLKSLQNHRIEMRLVEAKRRLGQVYDVRLQPRMCAKKCVYVLGGYNRELGRRWNESTTLVTVERLETFKCQWKTLSPMLHSRSGHGVAVLNNLIYVIGGESDCLIFSNGEVYDPVSNQWSMICSMNLPRCALGTCALNGYLYALGGWVGAEIGDTMEQYDPLVNKWTIIGKMSIPRYAMGVVAYQGLIYIIGGLSALSTELDLVESFNPVTGEWNRLAPLSTRCAYVGVAVLHDQIYTVGGTNNSHAALRTVERYSIEENKWTEVTSVKTARAGASVISVNGRLLVIGGRTSSDEFSAPVTLNTVEVYDPETNSWTESTHMPTSRCEAGVAVL
ncbi:actin-binding protein IPP-like [Tachypleus tridentatus]|uniref:actin-binding protein IPP-like n=1 Tax=Tachypleus tridentatus TaxID=6853 RepID=UPI003FD14407